MGEGSFAILFWGVVLLEFHGFRGWLVILVCVYFGALKLFECRMLSIYEFVLKFHSECFRNVSALVTSVNFLGIK